MGTKVVGVGGMGSEQNKRMRLAKSIEELYSEVRDNGCDLVITTDISLATALNKRLDIPLLGKFATTPLNIASEMSHEVLGTHIPDDMKVIRIIADETGYDLRFIHGEVKNIREIRRHTMDVRKFISHSRASLAVYESYSAIPTIEKAMEMFDTTVSKEYFSQYRKVAVIGLDESYDNDDPGTFNDLEKHMLPEDYVKIDRFHEDGAYEIIEIHDLGNDRQLCNNVVSLIKGDPENYAMVIDPSSPMTDTLKAALYRHNIPFINSIKAKDIPIIREFLEFINTSFDYNVLRCKDVKNIYNSLNGFFKEGLDNNLLSRLHEDEMHGRSSLLRNLMKDINGFTFSQACDVLFQCRDTAPITRVLDDAGFTDTIVDRDTASDLTYLILNVDDMDHGVEVSEQECKGVLLADARKVAFIDRPIVFYLGMGTEWDFDIIGRRYIDVRDETYSEKLRFQLLLQQGVSRGYFINSTKDGKPAKPCMTFDDIFGYAIDSFEDVVHDSIVHGRWTDDCERNGLKRLGERFVSDSTMLLSKTSLSHFIRCPRAYLFSHLLHMSGNEATEMGNLIHEFAEAYSIYRDELDELGHERILESISDYYSGLSSPATIEIDEDRISLEIRSISSFLDSMDVRAPKDLSRKEYSKRNRILDDIDAEYCSSLCEKSSVDDELHIKGVMDLLWKDSIVDYKTGRMYEESKYAEMISPLVDGDYKDFQPLMYLLMGDSFDPKVGRFIYFYAGANDVDLVRNGFSDLDGNRMIVERFRGDIHEAISECLSLTARLDGYPEASDMEFTREFTARVHRKMIEKVKNVRYDKKLVEGFEDIFNKDCLEYISKNMFNRVKTSIKTGIAIGTGFIMVPDETMEEFRKFLADSSKMIDGYRSSDFPAKPLKDCSRCDFKTVCTRDIITAEEVIFDE